VKIGAGMTIKSVLSFHRLNLPVAGRDNMPIMAHLSTLWNQIDGSFSFGHPHHTGIPIRLAALTSVVS
jgi:hypothetical protein